MIAALMSLMLSLTPQDPTIVWSAPQAEPTPIVVTPAPAPTIDLPDWARADPYAWERAQCSPLLRGDEDLQACQARVRGALAANLGDALPVGLAAGAPADQCRQEAAGDRYALQCGAPSRSGPETARLVDRTCETRPRAQREGGVIWTEECRPADGSEPAEEGLRIRLGGND